MAILSLYENPDRFDAIARQVDDDIHWWRKQFKRPSVILDLGCGTGRIALPLAWDGHRLIGIDNAPEMLKSAQRKDVQNQCQWVQADLCNLEQFEAASVDAVIVANNTISHIHDEKTLAALMQQALGVLKPGGRFMVDTFAPTDDLRQDGQEELLTYQDAQRGGGITLIEGHRYDPETSLMHVEWYHCAKGQTVSEVAGETMSLRLWQALDLLSIAQLCGFSRVQLAGDYDASPFDEDSPLILFEATK